MRNLIAAFSAGLIAATTLTFAALADPLNPPNPCAGGPNNVGACNSPAPAPPTATPSITTCTRTGVWFTLTGSAVGAGGSTCAPLVMNMKANYGKQGSQNMPAAPMNLYFRMCQDNSVQGNVGPTGSEKAWGNAVGTATIPGCLSTQYTNFSLGADYIKAGCKRNDHPRMDNLDVANTAADTSVLANNMYQHDPSLGATPSPADRNRALGSASCTPSGGGANVAEDLDQIILSRAPYESYATQWEIGTLVDDGGILASPFPWNTPKPTDVPRPPNCDGLAGAAPHRLTEDCYQVHYDDQMSQSNGRGTGGGITSAQGPQSSMELDPTLNSFDLYNGGFSGVGTDTANFLASRVHNDGSPYLQFFNGLATTLDDTPISQAPGYGIAGTPNNINGHGQTCPTAQAAPSNVIGGGVEGAFMWFAQTGNRRGFKADHVPQVINCASDMYALGKVMLDENYDRSTVGNHYDWRVSITAANLLIYDPDYNLYGLDIYDSSQNGPLGMANANVHPEDGIVPITPADVLLTQFVHGTCVAPYTGTGCGNGSGALSGSINANGTSGGANTRIIKAGVDRNGFDSGVYYVGYANCTYFGIVIGPCGSLVNATHSNVAASTLTLGRSYAHMIDCNDIQLSQPQCGVPTYKTTDPPTPAPAATDGSFFNGANGSSINFGSGVGAGASLCSVATSAHPYGNVPSACPTWSPSTYILPADGGSVILFGN